MASRTDEACRPITQLGAASKGPDAPSPFHEVLEARSSEKEQPGNRSLGHYREGCVEKEAPRPTPTAEPLRGLKRP
jgi:hypothetical protein